MCQVFSLADDFRSSLWPKVIWLDNTQLIRTNQRNVRLQTSNQIDDDKLIIFLLRATESEESWVAKTLNRHWEAELENWIYWEMNEMRSFQEKSTVRSKSKGHSLHWVLSKTGQKPSKMRRFLKLNIYKTAFTSRSSFKAPYYIKFNARQFIDLKFKRHFG